MDKDISPKGVLKAVAETIVGLSDSCLAGDLRDFASLVDSYANLLGRVDDLNGESVYIDGVRMRPIPENELSIQLCKTDKSE